MVPTLVMPIVKQSKLIALLHVEVMLVVRLVVVVISSLVKMPVRATVPASTVVHVSNRIQNIVKWTMSQKILNCLF